MKLRLLLLALTIFACSSCVKEISTQDPDLAWETYTSFSATAPKKGTFEVLNANYDLYTDYIFSGYDEIAYFKIIADKEWSDEFKRENRLNTDRISEHRAKEVIDDKFGGWFNADSTYTVLSFASGDEGYFFQKKDTVYIYFDNY